MEDALRLLVHLSHGAGHPSGLPRDLRSPSPNLPPPPTQGNKIDCARPDCRTISGSCTQGSKTCLENKCKKCCVQAAADAFANGQARKQCHAHSQPETIAHADSQPQLTVPLQNITAPVGFLPQDVPPLTPPPNQPSLVQSHDIPEPPAPTQPRQFAATMQPQGLAQPVGGTWAKNLNQVESQRQNTKNLKVQQHAMDEQMKRTCLFVVYHTVCLTTISNTYGCL